MVHTLKVSRDTSRWTKTDSPGSPSGRYGHRAVVYQDKMILHGGYNGKDRLNDTFEFDLEKKEWKLLEGEGTVKPCARDCHSAVLYKDQMFVFGGGDGYAWKNDVWCYNITTRMWSEVKVAAGSVLPSGRAGHSAVVHQNKMMVFGGWNGRRTLNDLYTFDLDTFLWTSIQAKGQLPQSRDSHTACIYTHFMYIVGGGDGKQRLNDMYQYDIKANFWTRFECIGEVNAGRAGHVAVQQGHRMIIFGGGDGLKWLTDVYECDIKAKKWYLSESTGDIAPGSYGLSAVPYKNKMIIFGGGDGKSWYNSVYEFVCCDEKSKEQTQNNLFRTWNRGMYHDIGIEFTDDASLRIKARTARTNLSKFHSEPELAPTSSVSSMSEGLAPLTVPSSLTKPKRRKDSPVRSPVVAL